jgi:molybdenum cofactor biosynthesis protein B
MIKAKSEFIFCIGGTGISRKDLTIDAVKPIIRREIPGFSELFRQLSYKDIGTRAMLSRAMMGIASGNTVICCLPGSANAIQLATTKIILPECDHIIAELNK